jgi:hypothetical protein
MARIPDAEEIAERLIRNERWQSVLRSSEARRIARRGPAGIQRLDELARQAIGDPVRLAEAIATEVVEQRLHEAISESVQRLTRDMVVADEAEQTERAMQSRDANAGPVVGGRGAPVGRPRTEADDSLAYGRGEIPQQALSSEHQEKLAGRRGDA